jgi:hypothetical protein
MPVFYMASKLYKKVNNGDLNTFIRVKLKIDSFKKTLLILLIIMRMGSQK